jgi:hypothetical protein
VPSVSASPGAAPVSPPPAVAAPPTTASRVEVLNAATAAYRSGDLKTAAGLYERVVDTPPGASEGASAALIDAFAHFRAMIVLLADGREDDARAQLAELQAREPDAPLARLGSQLWDQYSMTGQVRGACAQLQPQIVSQASATLNALQGLGVNVDPQTLCAVPQG